MARLGAAGALLLMLLVESGAQQKHGSAVKRGRHETTALVANKAATHGEISRSLKTKGKTEDDELEIETLFAAKILEVAFESEEEKKKYEGRYDPKAITITDVTGDTKRGQCFLASPLMKDCGVASLYTIPCTDSNDNATKDLPLKPYPSLDQHYCKGDSGDCNSMLVSVTAITKSSDDEDTLYVLDSGISNIGTSQNSVCGPKIVVFDLVKNVVIYIVLIEKHACDAMYVKIVVAKDRGGCPIAYISDYKGNILTVTNITSGISKHVQNEYFYPEPDMIPYHVGNLKVPFHYGIAAIEVDNSDDGKMYSQSVASKSQCSFDKEAIRNASNGAYVDIKNKFTTPGRIAAMALYHNAHCLYYASFDDMTLYARNTNKPKNARKIAHGQECLKFVVSVKIDHSQKQLLVMSNSWPEHATGTIDYNENNYLVCRIHISETKC